MEQVTLKVPRTSKTDGRSYCWHCGTPHSHPFGVVGCCLFAPDTHLDWKSGSTLAKRPTICIQCNGPSERTFCCTRCAKKFNEVKLEKWLNRVK